MKAGTQTNEVDWDDPQIAALVRAALDEDLGANGNTPGGDLTTNCLVPAEVRAHARIVAKQPLVLAGLPLAERIFRALDSAVRLQARFAEGTRVPKGAGVAEIEGQARAVLTAERTALNVLAHLSGIATLTREFVEAVAATPAVIRDTRKTTPLLRRIEKYAVRVGGGTNHRFGLYDALLVKENHIVLAGGVAEAVRRARQRATSPPAPPIEVEVRNEAELHAALAAGADCLLLDNLSPAEAGRLIRIARQVRPGCAIELSGGVNLANVRAYAEAGADFIAIGALTHSAPAADLSLLVEPSSV